MRTYPPRHPQYEPVRHAWHESTRVLVALRTAPPGGS